MEKKDNKNDIKKRAYDRLVFFGMIINFMVIGVIFWFVLTTDKENPPPHNPKYDRYLKKGAPEAGQEK